MFNAAPSNKFEYEIGFFFGMPPGATGAIAAGGDMDLVLIYKRTI
jgi:hypothetical protein